MALRPINDGFKKQMEREVIQGFLNLCLNKLGMTNGATSCVAFTSYAQSYFVYTIGGKIFSAPIVTSGFAIGAAGMSNVGSGQARLYAVCMTSNQSIVCWAGSAVSIGLTAYCDTPPASQCVLGTFLVSCASTSTWVAGSALNSAAPWEWSDCFMVAQGVIINV
jgi:hypothetical protein